MRLNIQGKTNKDYVRINTAKFKLKSGSVLTVDRDETEYSINLNGELTQSWNKCYLWALDDRNIFTDKYGRGMYPSDDYDLQEIKKLLEGAELELELEDDTDEEYRVDVSGWSIS